MSGDLTREITVGVLGEVEGEDWVRRRLVEELTGTQSGQLMCHLAPLELTLRYKWTRSGILYKLLVTLFLGPEPGPQKPGPEFGGRPTPRGGATADGCTVDQNGLIHADGSLFLFGSQLNHFQRKTINMASDTRPKLPLIDEWSLKEKLVLASSVSRTGDQNW